MPTHDVSVTQINLTRKETDRTMDDTFGNPFKDTQAVLMQEWVILDKLLPVILFHRKGCLVEIGVGHSTFYMCKHAYDYKRKVYSIDWNSKKLSGFSYIRIYNGHKPIWCSSDEFMEKFNEPCAVVLIDGSHDYETAKKEFDFFYGKLVEGGVIFLHDTYPPVAEGDDPAAFLSPIGAGNVWKLRQELEKNRTGMEIFTWPYTAGWSGLTMILKKEKELPYWGE